MPELQNQSDKANALQVQLQRTNNLFKHIQKDISQALPRLVDPDRFLRVLFTQVQTNPQLAQCEQRSLIIAVMRCAQYGLEPDNITGKAWLIPRREKGVLKCNFQLGYKGCIELARRSGEVSAVAGLAAFDCDHFDFEYGTQQRLRHIPNLNRPEGAAWIASWFGVHLKDGGYQFAIANAERVIRAQQKSTSKNKQGQVVGPWVTDFEPMSIKVAVTDAAKLLPQCPELQSATQEDELIDRGIEVAPPPEAQETLTKLGSMLEDDAGEKKEAAEKEQPQQEEPPAQKTEKPPTG